MNALERTLAATPSLDLPQHAADFSRFAGVDSWVFDLDNTLYPASSDLWPKIDARITLFLMHYFGLDGLSARALQKYYYHTYGTTLRGLMREQDLAATAFLDFVHDIDRSSLLPHPALAEAVAALPGRKLILTNGSRDHALRTVEALGLGKTFEDVFDVVAADFVPKPDPDTYQRFFDKHGIDPARAAMFEDLAKNLVVPAARGMATVLVVPPPNAMDHRDAVEITSEIVPAHIDFVTSDLAGFLAAVLAARTLPHSGAAQPSLDAPPAAVARDEGVLTNLARAGRKSRKMPT